MDTHKINVKFFLEKGHDVAPETWFQTFNEWIPDEQNEVWVDVADYSHVKAGPVTLLVGHEANYSIDNTNERLGLLYCRKQPQDGTFADRLKAAFRRACQTCQRLEENLDGQVSFRGNQAQLTLNDRRLAPNTKNTLKAIRSDLEALLNTLYAGANITLEHDSDPKRLFTLNIQAEGDWKINNLLENI